MEVYMELEDCIATEENGDLSGKIHLGRNRDYLPFGVKYLEDPKPIGQTSDDIFAYTSATFCTFRMIPLLDDGD